jgi:type VI secretion system protein ImpM
MGFGVFGKLPQKRDFITFGIPNAVLNPLETWLQSAVAASRAELGQNWQDLYLVAPIWRFWIGPRIFGQGCAGVIMPSVDRVGRFFPLLGLYCTAEGEQLPPPPFAPQGEWYAALDARLLPTLEEGVEIEVDRLMEGLPPPSIEVSTPSDGAGLFKGDPLWQAQVGSQAAGLLTSIVESDYREVAKVRSYWWTAGSPSIGPILHAKEGLPDPYFYTLMLKLVAD